MTKACSLDFLNNAEFHIDVITEDGRILYPMGTPVTPELLLQLYFKDIYFPKKLEFDEGHAQRVKDYSVRLAKMIGMPHGNIEELKDAAYYHDIGITKFTESDLKKFDFDMWQGEAGVNILINERQFPKHTAEVASAHLKNYMCARFPLVPENKNNVPYAHIVAIANCYDELSYKNLGKIKALEKMIKLGGEKFNIYLLHKFVKAMRSSDG